jgi:hypothetical protein
MSSRDASPSSNSREREDRTRVLRVLRCGNHGRNDKVPDRLVTFNLHLEYRRVRLCEFGNMTPSRGFLLAVILEQNRSDAIDILLSILILKRNPNAATICIVHQA